MVTLSKKRIEGPRPKSNSDISQWSKMIKKMKKNDKDVLQDIMNIENWGFFHTMFYGVNAPPKMSHVYTIQKSIGGTCNWILKEIKKIWKIYKKFIRKSYNIAKWDVHSSISQDAKTPRPKWDSVANTWKPPNWSLQLKDIEVLDRK